MTTVMNNAAYANTANKPIPGESVVTQTTITTQAAPVAAVAPRTGSKGFNIFASIFGVLAGLGMFLGAILIIIAMGLLLRDSFRHYNAIGILLIIGFSLWLLSAFLNWLPTCGGFTRTNRSGYHILNFFAAPLSMAAFIIFIAGAGCWLSSRGNVRFAGEILWIIAASIWLLSLILRDMGVRYDAQETYKRFPVVPTTAGTTTAPTTTHKAALGAHLSSMWSNALATDLYIIAAVLFLIGAIMFNSRGRTAPYDLFASRKFEVAAGVLWLVGAGIVLIASILHCIARR